MRHKRKIVPIAALIVILALGCLYLLATANDYQCTKFNVTGEGMTRSEIHALIGKPDDVATFQIEGNTRSFETWLSFDGHAEHFLNPQGVSIHYSFKDNSWRALLAKLARYLGF